MCQHHAYVSVCTPHPQDEHLSNKVGGREALFYSYCEMSKIIHSEVSLMVAVWYGRYFTTSPDLSALWISAISCTKKSMVAEGAQFFV